MGYGFTPWSWVLYLSLTLLSGGLYWLIVRLVPTITTLLLVQCPLPEANFVLVKVRAKNSSASPGDFTLLHQIICCSGPLSAVILLQLVDGRRKFVPVSTVSVVPLPHWSQVNRFLASACLHFAQVCTMPQLQECSVSHLWIGNMDCLCSLHCTCLHNVSTSKLILCLTYELQKRSAFVVGTTLEASTMCELNCICRSAHLIKMGERRRNCSPCF